jgi:hypothetical protein
MTLSYQQTSTYTKRAKIMIFYNLDHELQERLQTFNLFCILDSMKCNQKSCCRQHFYILTIKPPQKH